MAEAILKLPSVRKRCGLSRTAIYNFIRDGKFPAQVELGGPRAVGWFESEIDAWIAARSKKTDAKAVQS